MEYLESVKDASVISHIDLGFHPANDMGACIRFMPMQNESDSVLFGAMETTGNKTWYFGGKTTFYLSWNSNPVPQTRPSLVKNSIYEIRFNYMNDRNRKIVGIDGAKVNTTADEYNLAINEVLNGGAVFDQSAYLFTFNFQGAPYTNVGSYRIYSATFTKGGKVAMDLVPVRKDGVGYMYDRVSNRLLGKRTDDLPDFSYGKDVADTTKPYDAQVEYLESVKDASVISHIDLGFHPANDMGACIRFMPMQNESDSVLFGAMETTGNKTWYFGGKTTFYLSWNSNPLPQTRPSLARNSMYEVRFNYMNDRNRKIVGIDGAKVNTTADEYNLAITEVLNGGAVFDQSAYLFTFNFQGAPYTNVGSYRIYSATFTKGGKVAMDLVPVRKDGVGYMYDRVSNRLLGKRTDDLPDFAHGGDVADTTWLTMDATLEEDMVRNVALDDGEVIDLMGRKLTAYALVGVGTITDSSGGEPGELHIVVPEGQEASVSLALSGNLKVVKEGAGALVLARSGQTFAGGVVVAEGTARGAYPEDGTYWGPNGGEITVLPGAVFDNKGFGGYAAKRFVLAGGTLANTGTDMESWDDRIVSHVKLTADSHIHSESCMHFWTQSPGDGSCIDLGGHSLSIAIGLNKYLYLNTVVSNGTIEVESGGYLTTSSNGVDAVKHGSDTLDLRAISCALDIRADMSVRDYYAGYAYNWNEGDSKLLVYGTFTPAAVDASGNEYFHGCEMQDGSSIDLSAKSSAFGVVATGFSGTGTATGNRTITFADDATVRILLGARAPDRGDKIIDWSDSAPANRASLKFYGETANGRKIALKTKSDGVYVSFTGLSLILK